MTTNYGHNYILAIALSYEKVTTNLAFATSCEHEPLRVNETTRAVYHQYDREFNNPKLSEFRGRPLSGYMYVNLENFEVSLLFVSGGVGEAIRFN